MGNNARKGKIPYTIWLSPDEEISMLDKFEDGEVTLLCDVQILGIIMAQAFKRGDVEKR